MFAESKSLWSGCEYILLGAQKVIHPTVRKSHTEKETLLLYKAQVIQANQVTEIRAGVLQKAANCMPQRVTRDY